MTQDEKWLIKYNEVVAFIKANKRNPSRHDDQERYRYCNWLKHNKKLMNSGALKEERLDRVVSWAFFLMVSTICIQMGRLHFNSSWHLIIIPDFCFMKR